MQNPFRRKKKKKNLCTTAVSRVTAVQAAAFEHISHNQHSHTCQNVSNFRSVTPLCAPFFTSSATFRPFLRPILARSCVFVCESFFCAFYSLLRNCNNTIICSVLALVFLCALIRYFRSYFRTASTSLVRASSNLRLVQASSNLRCVTTLCIQWLLQVQTTARTWPLDPPSGNIRCR